MKNNKVNFLSILLLMTLGILAQAQNEPILFEAESGTLGAEFTTLEESGITYITILTNGVAQFPESAARVATYTVNFPSAGTYDLYARIRVGSGGADDDSFFYGNGFGVKNPTQADDWQRMNNLYAVGFTVENQYVTGGGSAQSNVWKWINLSEFTGDETPVVFTVEEGSLTNTFQIGAREDGLDFDKFAFAPSDLFYTVKNLDNGEAGVPEIPDPGATTPIASGKDKFIGNVYSNSQLPNFKHYWNQVTPENAGKWGSVEGTRNVMNWGQLDAAYALAKDNGFPFRMHVMIWGNQQPSWIETLPTSEQRAEIEQWFELVAGRYPDIDFVEVVNEPLHDPPNQPGSGGGNYIAALGGNGTTGWDWVLESFRLARQHFPNSKLMMNDYSIVNNTSNIQKYIQIINLLKAEDLIDHLGVQAHAFSINDLPAATLKANLDLLATTGLPIYVTEMDIDGPTDERQLERYRTVFPVFWEHPSVEGITLWGYRPGMWRTEQMAYLIENDGITERPALVWMRKYVAGEFVPVSSIEVTSPSNSVEEEQTLQMSATVNPSDATFSDVTWTVTASPGSQGQATIDANGLLTATRPGNVRVTASATDGSKITGEKTIGITAMVITSLGEEAFTGIYPNPVTNGNVSIRSSGNISKIDLLDLHGKMIESWNFQNNKEIELYIRTLPGMYLLQIHSDYHPRSHKIIVR